MTFNLRSSFGGVRFVLYFFLAFTAFISSPGFSAAATQVTLAWDENSEPDLAGYFLYVREADEAYNYSSPAWEGGVTSCTIYDLVDTVDYCFIVRAYDTNGNESADSNETCTKAASTNEAPIANAGPDQNAESNEVVILNGLNSIDLDDGIASFVWEQVNFNGLSVELFIDPLEPSYATFVAPEVGSGGESLTFKLTVTDIGGLQNSDTCLVSVKAVGNDQPANESTIHIGAIEGTSLQSRKNKWKASVNIEVHDNYCYLVDGVTVNGTWSGGYNGSGSCITQEGICSVISGDINIRKIETKFTIQNILSPNFTYDSAENHFFDGDSVGYDITVSKP